MNNVISSPLTMPSFKFPLESPSEPCEIIRVPETWMKCSFIPAFISSFRSLKTNSCKIRLVEDPLKKARSAVELSVKKMNTSVPLRSPSFSMH